MPTSEALKLAQNKDLDLIEIVETTNPPIVRIMDFGKFKYEKEKGERANSKKQKESEMKEIKIGFTTGKHDLELRAGQIKKFLGQGDKVRINMRLKGREKAHSNLALNKFHEFLKIIRDSGSEFNLEEQPKRFPQGYAATVTAANTKKSK